MLKINTLLYWFVCFIIGIISGHMIPLPWSLLVASGGTILLGLFLYRIKIL